MMVVTWYGKLAFLLLFHCEVVSNELLVVKYSRTSGSLPTTISPIRCAGMCSQGPDCVKFHVSSTGNCLIHMEDTPGANYGQIGLPTTQPSVPTTLETTVLDTTLEETTAGALVTTAGVPVTTVGVPVTTTGVPVTTAGVPVTTAGVPVTTAGVPVTTAATSTLACAVPLTPSSTTTCKVQAAMAYKVQDGVRITVQINNEFYSMENWQDLTSSYTACKESPYSQLVGDSMFQTYYNGVVRYVSFQGDYVHLYEETTPGTLTSMSGFPQKIQDIFDSASYPVSAAAIYAGPTDTTGQVHMIKDKELIVYNFVATASGMTANYVDKYDLDKGEVNPLNQAPQNPTQVPYPLEALYISKATGKCFGFSGKEMFMSDWGTGIWTSLGDVRCP